MFFSSRHLGEFFLNTVVSGFFIRDWNLHPDFCQLWSTLITFNIACDRHMLRPAAFSICLCVGLNPVGSCPEERVWSPVRPPLRLSAPAQMDEPKAGPRTRSLVHLPSLCVLCMSCLTAIRSLATSKAPQHGQSTGKKRSTKWAPCGPNTEIITIPLLSSPLHQSKPFKLYLQQNKTLRIR